MLVKRLSRLLITLPVLAMPMAMLPVKYASAAGSPAEQAVRLLSKAKVADSRCNILSGGERAELSRYVARAEVAAASQAGSKAAQSAAAAGSAEGQNAACSDDLRADVRETLVAAREAVAATGTNEPEPAARTQTARKVKPALPKAEARAERGGLARYARIVQAYYLERECHSLPKSDQGRFWKGIVNLHRATVAANGASRVAPLMQRAERRAQRSGCGRMALAKIRRGYAEILSR